MNELIPNIWMNGNQQTKNDIAYVSRWAPEALTEDILLPYMKILPRALYGYGLFNIYAVQLGKTCA